MSDSNKDVDMPVEVVEKEAKGGKKVKKSSKKAKDKKPWSKKKKVIVGVSIVAVMLVGGILGLNSARDKTNYYSVWRSIFNNELGSFRFVVDVRTGDSDDKEVKEDTKTAQEESKESGKDSKLDSNTPEELYADESEDSDKEEESNSDESWTDANGVKGGIWQYPNYKLVVEGCTTSVKPLNTEFTLSLTTENFSENLTTVTVVDDKVYVNVEQLQYWLKNSKDEYFISLASELPENCKYMILPLDKVKLISNYAEEGEKKGYEGDLVNAYRRFSTIITSLVTYAEDTLGNTGLAKQEDLYSISIEGKDGSKVGNTVAGIIKNRENVYNKLVYAQKDKGLLSDEQFEQKVMEKDNFLSATDEAERYVNTHTKFMEDVEVAGNARIYTGGKGTTNLEATLQTSFKVGGTNYSITVQGMRNGNSVDIKAPQASSSKIEQQNFYDVLTDVFSYLNITNIDLSKRLEVTPDKISEDILSDFADMVNNTESTNEKLSANSAKAFIDKYKDYVENEDTTTEDTVNAQLVSDLIAELNSITDGSTSDSKASDGQTDRFRVVDKKVGDITIIARYNDDESTAKLGVLDITLLNSSDKEQTFNLKDLSLQTMLSSKYPVNDEVTIHDYDNKFDESVLEGKVKIPANGFSRHKCFVVTGNGLEYMDLFYGDEKVGDIISR